MNCPKCQTENHEGAKFCNECAYDLRKVPQALSTDYSQPQTYTPQFLQDKILTTKGAIEGERKSVTVLFADVANYTSMSEKLDPEQVHKVMDGCFKILMEQIHKHEGTINQFTGDGVMALFGAPIAHEDHAQRACWAALGIQEALEGYGNQLKTKLGIAFRMRIGLNSGPVVVGSIGDDLRMDYTAIGDTTNLASRMEDMAQAGTVLLSQNTYKIVRQGFKCRSLGKHTFKGKEVPIEAFKLEAGHEGYKPRVGLERQIFSEMVGRTSELNRLEFQVMKAVNGEGSIVNIIGEAGIGKSRLVAELKNQSVMKKSVLLEGRAISMGRNLSFHPIIDLLKHWARIREDDSEAASFDKLRSSIRSLCQEHAEEGTDEILPFVATLLGMKLFGKYAERVKGIEGEALEKLILKNVRDLLLTASGQTPLVIVTEDLHWADTSSIELLESLFRLTETERIIFVNVFRPDHKRTSDYIVETIKEKYPAKYTEIVLQPLDERTSEILINNMLNITGLQHRVRRQIIERSGGNPYFIEEVVRSFIDEGAVVVNKGAFEVTEKINAMVIPQTINDVLMARIDRLEEETRELVKMASVIGRNFFRSILSEVATSTQKMDQRLSYLKEIQLIRERKRMEELEYLFKHALAQEVAYESILMEKRKTLHLKTAQGIERVFRDRLHEFYGMLAYHYGKAEDYEKTEHYLIKAGEEALRSSASSEALNYYQEGLYLYLRYRKDDIDPEKVAIFEKNIGIAYHNKCRWVECGEHIDLALEQWKIATSPNKIITLAKFIFNYISITTGLYSWFENRKHPPDHKDIEIFDVMIKRDSGYVFIDNTKFFFASLSTLSRVLRFEITAPEQINYIGGVSAFFSYGGLSLRFANKLLMMIERKYNKNDIRSSMVYLSYSTVFNACSGNWDQLRSYEQGAVEKALKAGLLFEVTTYIYFFCLVSSESGSFKKTRIIIKKLFEIGASHDYDNATMYALGLEEDLLLKKGKLSEASLKAEQGLVFCRQRNMNLQELVSAGFRVEALSLQNVCQETQTCIDQAKLIIDQNKFIPPLFIVPFLVAQFVTDIQLLKKGMESNDSSNLSHLRKKARKSGKAALRKLGKHAPYRTKAFRLMGEYYWLIGKQRKALKWWNNAMNEGERLGARVDLSRTYMEVGKSLLETKSKYKELNGIREMEYLKKARTLFIEMDLQYDLEELERISATN